MAAPTEDWLDCRDCGSVVPQHHVVFGTFGPVCERCVAAKNCDACEGEGGHEAEPYGWVTCGDCDGTGEAQEKQPTLVPCLGMDGACVGCEAPIAGLCCTHPPWSKTPPESPQDAPAAPDDQSAAQDP